MTWFHRSNQIEEFAEAIRPELRQSPVPSASDDLLERIIANRNSGTRVILPDIASSPVKPRWRLAIPALIAAALLLMVVPFRRSSRVDSPQGDASSLSRIATEWLPGSVALAQTEISRTARKAPPMTFVRPRTLRPMRLEYLRTWRDSTKKETGRINGTMTVERTMRDGTPAFLIVSVNNGARDGRRLLTVDSVSIAQDNLRLLRHYALERPYSRYDEIVIDQIFRGDSVIGRMRVTKTGSLAGQRPIARKLASSSGPYIVDALAPIILGTANLRAGWSGSAAMVGWAVRDDDVFMPIETRVLGEDTVAVPAGHYDCWRLSIGFPGGLVTYWVRKSDGVGVRAMERKPSGATREVVLVTSR